MEKLKPLSQILEPDDRNRAFTLTLEEHHAQAADIRLSANVPEDVRSYFATVQNLYVYAWFSYDFYPFVMFHCWALIELALRLRFSLKDRPGESPRHKRARDKRTLGTLLQEAFKHKAIKEKGFSRYRWYRQRFANGLRQERAWRQAISTYPRTTRPVHRFQESLFRYLTGMRNSWAHPKGHSIVVPGQATGELIFAADFINQLFPKPIKE